jgi:hypothetical protein
VKLTDLAHASVQQLREAIRRVTLGHVDATDQLDEDEFLAGIEVSDSTWADWEETSFDVRQFRGGGCPRGAHIGRSFQSCC